MARAGKNWKCLYDRSRTFLRTTFYDYFMISFFFRSMISTSFCGGAFRWKSVHAFRMSSFIWHVSFIHSLRYIEWSIFVLSSYCLENCCCCSRENDFHTRNRGISLWGILRVCFFLWRDNRGRFQGFVLVVIQYFGTYYTFFQII